MAVITEIQCQICGEFKDVLHSVRDTPIVCDECAIKKKTEMLNSMSPEQRLKRLEDIVEKGIWFDKPIG